MPFVRPGEAMTARTSRGGSRPVSPLVSNDYNPKFVGTRFHTPLGPEDHSEHRLGRSIFKVTQ